MNALSVKGLIREYEGFRLDIPLLELPEGCILGLIGENGAGKSTAMRLILGAGGRKSGSIEVLGCDNTAPAFREIKEELGVVLDEAYFPEVLTARQVNTVMKHTYRRWHEEGYFDLLRRFDLPEGKQFRDYSRGMRMKLAIAVALSHEPRLLLLDEATGGLDPIVRDEILDIFNDFTRASNHSVLISSHIVSDLEKICDMIAFLHKGRLMFCEPKDELAERFGLLRCTHADFERVDRSSVVGMRSSSYGVEALLMRESATPGLRLDRPSLEDIMLLMTKGEEDR